MSGSCLIARLLGRLVLATARPHEAFCQPAVLLTHPAGGLTSSPQAWQSGTQPLLVCSEWCGLRRYESIIATLCENLDTLDEPEAKASMIWIIGEYAERIDNADELLEQFLETFPEEQSLVRLENPGFSAVPAFPGIIFRAVLHTAENKKPGGGVMCTTVPFCAPSQVQLQLVTATVKLFLKKPTEKPQAMIQLVLTYATQETDNPDLRDRA